MDSVTQVVLGAAVGEACLGKKVGNKAALWGAIGGTIPDLDVAANFFMGQLDAMVVHRGVSHSIVFSMVMAPIMGWSIYKIYKERQGTQSGWTKLAFWALFTHPLLDCFTTWGTQLFYPFSDYRVAFNSIFVVDPVYTLPFALCLGIALFLKRQHRWRSFWNWLGIGLSCFYLLITVINKLTVESIFGNSMHRRGISATRFSTYPLPLNLKWYVVAEEPSGYEIATYHLLKSSPADLQYEFIGKQGKLRDQLDGNYVYDRLRWMAKDYYVLRPDSEGLNFHDLRFGIWNFLPGQEPMLGFVYQLIRTDGEITDIEQKRPEIDLSKGESWSAFGRFIWEK
ncbi:MAG: metal-dependent hydrolase [Bacteroidota bacterium]